ncbi:MAG: hypothetical protein ABSD56_08510 [Bryobacteraceae bacterium]
MKSSQRHTLRGFAYCLTLGLLAASGLAFAQDPKDAPPPTSAPALQQSAAPSGGWRRVSDAPAGQPALNPDSPASTNDSMSRGTDPDPAYATSDQAPAPMPPARLTIRPGTFIAVRLDQELSSDQNDAGDAFSATLVRPVVVDGVVVAQPGQVLGGRVVEAQKAGRVQHVSRLGIELTDLTLVDGQQVRIQSQLMSLSGPTSRGRDATAIVGTTGLGAAIGAAAEGGGVGAGIGAAAGAAAGVVGVLLTRGHPTVLDPETMLTFRITAPVAISTARAPQAFRYVDPDDYDRSTRLQTRAPAPRRLNCGWYGCGPSLWPYYYYGPGFYPYYYPYYWGSGFSFFYGPRFYGGGGFFRGGGRFGGHFGGRHR